MADEKIVTKQHICQMGQNKPIGTGKINEQKITVLVSLELARTVSSRYEIVLRRR